MGRGNESVIAKFGSHDQDGRQTTNGVDEGID